MCILNKTIQGRLPYPSGCLGWYAYQLHPKCPLKLLWQPINVLTGPVEVELLTKWKEVYKASGNMSSQLAEEWCLGRRGMCSELNLMQTLGWHHAFIWENFRVKPVLVKVCGSGGWKGNAIEQLLASGQASVWREETTSLSDWLRVSQRVSSPAHWC